MPLPQQQPIVPPPPTEPQAPAPPPAPEPIKVYTKADWDAATPILSGPPSVAGTPPLPKGKPSKWDDLFTAGLELGGMMIAPELGVGIKGFESLPALARIGSRMIMSGAGGEVGSIVGNTLARPNAGPPPKLSDITSRGQTAFLQGATGEGIGAGLSAGARALKLTAPFAGKMTQTGKEAAEVLGGHVTPAQVTDSHLLKVMDNIMQGSLFGGGRYRKFIATQEGKLQQIADQTLGQFGPKVPVEAAGRAYQTAQEAAHQIAKDTASKLYEDVDQLAGGVKVPLNSLLDFAEQESQRRGALAMGVRGGKGTGLIRKVESTLTPKETEATAAFNEAASQMGLSPDALATDPAHKALLTAMSEAGISPQDAEVAQVTFRQAHEIRSALGKIWRDANRTGDTQTRGIASQLLKRISGEMQTAADTQPGLRSAYDTATNAWKQMAQTFEQGVLQKAAKATPDAVVRTLIKPGRVEDIVRARQAVGVEGWKPVQSAHAQSLLEASDGSLVSGEELSRRLAKIKPETMAAIYPRGTDQGIAQLARVMKQVQTKGPGNMKMWIQLAQGGAIGGVLTGRVSVPVGALLLSPATLSRIVLSPTGRKWLTTGLDSTHPAAATRAAGQLAAWVLKEGLVDEGPSEPPPPKPGQPTQMGPGPVGESGMGGRAGGPPPGPPAAPLPTPSIR